MDRRLTERLVGAALLVLAGVLLIPLFLDGPGTDSGSDVQRLTLPAAEEPSSTRVIRLEQERETPVTPLRPPEPAVPEPQVTQTAPEPVPEREPELAPEPITEPEIPPAQTAAPAPVPEPETQAAPTQSAPAAAQQPPAAGGWVVQIGSFGNRDNAERLAAELRQRQYQSFITRLDSGGTTLHRVRIGPAGSRDEADALVRRLAGEGYQAQVVRD